MWIILTGSLIFSYTSKNLSTLLERAMAKSERDILQNSENMVLQIKVAQFYRRGCAPSIQTSVKLCDFVELYLCNFTRYESKISPI